MRASFTAALGALGLATVLATAATAAAPTDAERRALEAFAQGTDALWDRGDAAALADAYATDATLVLAPRAPALGREAIRDYFVRSFAQRPAQLRHVTVVDRIEMLAPGVAFVDAHVRLERRQPDGEWQTLRRFLNHSVVVRQGESWELQAVRAYLAPEPPTAATVPPTPTAAGG